MTAVYNLISSFYNAAYNAYYRTAPISSTAALPHQLGQKQFDEMVIPRTVEKEDNQKLIEEGNAFATELQTKLASLNITDAHLKQLAKEIETCDFQHAPESSFLLDRDLPYLAMEALRRGFLHPEHGQKQVATILNFWAALQYHHNPKNLETIPLFQGQAANPLAESLIKQTLTTSSMHDKTTPLTPFLEENKFDKFMENMRKLPASEQQFLLVPDVQGSDSLQDIAMANDGDPYKATISQVIKNGSSINVFSRVQHNGQAMRIVPSTGMMQAFLDAQYAEPVTINPRLYLSSEMQIRDCGPHSRDMMMSFPDHSGRSRCPSTADGYQAPWYDFSYHDFYHAITASAVPLQYRLAAVTASDALSEVAKSLKSQKGVEQLAISLIDMEYTQFQHFAKEVTKTSHADDFWATMNLQVVIQQVKSDSHDQLRLIGIAVPFEASSITAEDQGAAIRHIFTTLVEQKKGPTELTRDSFKAAVQSKRDSLEKDLNLATQRTLDMGKEIVKMQYGFYPSEPTSDEVELVKSTLRPQFDNQPILLAARQLGY